MTEEQETEIASYAPAILEDIVYNAWGIRRIDPLKRCVAKRGNLPAYEIKGSVYDFPNTYRKLVIQAPDEITAERYAIAHGISRISKTVKR